MGWDVIGQDSFFDFFGRACLKRPDFLSAEDTHPPWFLGRNVPWVLPDPILQDVGAFWVLASIDAIIYFAILAHCLHQNLPGSCVCLRILLHEGINKMSLLNSKICVNADFPLI